LINRRTKLIFIPVLEILLYTVAESTSLAIMGWLRRDN